MLLPNIVIWLLQVCRVGLNLNLLTPPTEVTWFVQALPHQASIFLFKAVTANALRKCPVASEGLIVTLRKF